MRQYRPGRGLAFGGELADQRDAVAARAKARLSSAGSASRRKISLPALSWTPTYQNEGSAKAVAGSSSRRELDLDRVVLDARGPIPVGGRIGRLSLLRGVILHAAMAEADPRVVLVVRDGSCAAEPVAADPWLSQQPPDFCEARRVAFVPGDPGAVFAGVVVPVLDSAAPRVLMPENVQGRMEEIVAMGEGPDGESDLLADEIQLGVVRDIVHEAPRREQEVCRDEPRRNRTCGWFRNHPWPREERHPAQ